MLFTEEKSQGFCESLIWSPEYVNVITSFSMLFFSLLGIFLNRTHNLLIITVFSNLFVNFIGSFGFHYSLYQGWGLIDTISMLISAYFGMFTIWIIILESILSRFLLFIVSSFMIVITNFLLVLSLADRCLDNFIGFNTVIAFPFIMIIVGAVAEIILFSIKGVEKRVVHYLITGVVMVFLSSLIWLLTEPFCYTHDNRIAYTFSHGFWHVFVSYGFYIIAVCNIYIHGFNRRNRSDLEYTFINTGFFKMFPRCIYEVNSSKTVQM